MKLKLKYIEECLKPNESKYSSPYEWFLNRNHIPFDLSSDANYYHLYNEFLDDLYELYLKTGSNYFWYKTTGELDCNYKQDLVPGEGIYLKKELLRDAKIKSIFE